MPVINLLHLAGITEITRTRQRITRARTRAPAVPPPMRSNSQTTLPTPGYRCAGLGGETV
jgi:hypothetical protein